MRNHGRWVIAAAAVLSTLHALGGIALAQVEVPEIDPGSISAGVALLTGGILMLRARRGSK